MKRLFALLLLSALPALGQTLPSAPSNVYAAGVSFNSAASPRVAGTALYAHLASDGTGTYVFSVYDAIPTTTNPISVTSNVGVGVAQKLFVVGKIPFYAPVAAGVSWNGSNTGWQWSGGVMSAVKLNKSGWHVYPNVRFSKSSVNVGSGYMLIPGILLGFQK